MKLPSSSQPMQTKNQYTELAKKYTEATGTARITQKGNRLSFRERLRTLYIFCLFATIVLQLISILTEGLAIYQGSMRLVNSSAGAFAAMIIIIFIIEGTKRATVPYVARFLVGGWIGQHKNYTTAFGLLTFLALSALVASAFLSVRSAPDIAAYLNNALSPPTLVEVDSINTHYDTKIAEIDQKLDREMELNRNSRGQLLIQSGVPIFEQLSSEKNALMAQKAAALVHADSTNKAAVSIHEADSQDVGGSLQNFAGVCEVFFVIFIFFMELYDRTSYLELPEKSKNLTEAAQVNQAAQPANTSSAYRRAPAATFKDYQKEENQKKKQSVKQKTKQPETIVKQQIQLDKTEVRYLKQRAKQTHRRSLESKSEIAREENRDRFASFVKKLKKAGVKTIVREDNTIDFQQL